MTAVGRYHQLSSQLGHYMAPQTVHRRPLGGLAVLVVTNNSVLVTTDQEWQGYGGRA